MASDTQTNAIKTVEDELSDLLKNYCRKYPLSEKDLPKNREEALQYILHAVKEGLNQTDTLRQNVEKLRQQVEELLKGQHIKNEINQS